MKVPRDFRNPYSTDKTALIIKVRKKAKIRKQYNQVPHLTQDTTWETDRVCIVIILWLIKQALQFTFSFFIPTGYTTLFIPNSHERKLCNLLLIKTNKRGIILLIIA